MRFGSAICLTLFLGFCVSLGADEVILKDGSKIVGTITAVSSNQIVITTEFMGEQKIDLANITSARSEDTREFVLESGEVAEGPIQIDEGKQSLANPDGSTKVVEIQELRAVRQPGTEELPPPPVVPPAPEPAVDWSGKVELGINGRTGNSDRLDWRFLTDALRTTEDDRLNLYFKSFFAQEDGDETERKFLGGAGYEIDISERDYAFAAIEAEHDDPRNIDLRSILTAGLGHFFIEKPEHEFKGRAGLGLQYESVSMGPDEIDVVIDLGYDYRIDIREYFRFVHDATFFAPFDELDAYRLVLNTAGEVPILPGEAWKLTVGMRNEYDNNTGPTVKAFDSWLYLTLGYTWD